MGAPSLIKMKKSKLLKVLLLVIIAFPVWCKLDVVETINGIYGSRQEQEDVIDEVKIHPALIPHSSAKQSSKFFKFRLIWRKHILRVSFRDFGKKHEKARIISAHISAYIKKNDTWSMDLALPKINQGWDAFEITSWSNEYSESVIFANAPTGKGFARIMLPPGENIFNLSLVFELQDKANQSSKNFSRKFTLERKPKKEYGSFLIAFLLS